jgi:hypothetical protein
LTSVNLKSAAAFSCSASGTAIPLTLLLLHINSSRAVGTLNACLCAAALISPWRTAVRVVIDFTQRVDNESGGAVITEKVTICTCCTMAAYGGAASCSPCTDYCRDSSYHSGGARAECSAVNIQP